MRLLNSPIYVGEYESIWFLDENTTTFSNDSYDYNINSTIWLSEDLFAVTVVPPGVSSDSDHPFVRSVPLLLRGLTLDALTLWVGWVLVVASLVQVLIVVFERRLFVCCHDGDDDDDGDDDYLDALEPPPAVGVDADGDALVGAVMMQLRNAIALQLHLRGLLADDDGDVFLDAAVGADPDIDAVSHLLFGGVQLVAGDVFYDAAEILPIDPNIGGIGAHVLVAGDITRPKLRTKTNGSINVPVFWVWT